MAKQASTKTIGKKTDATTTTEEIDREMASRAREKQRRGETPSRDERAALRRFEKADEEARRWRYYRTIPKKHWREMSGRANQIIGEQAERYGLPMGGAVIDLTEFLPAFHDFLAENKRALASTEDLASKDEEARRLKRVQADLAEMEYAKKRRELRHLDDVRRTFDFVAQTFRKASAELRKEFGDRAHQILEEAVNEARKVIEKFEGGNRDAEKTEAIG